MERRHLRPVALCAALALTACAVAPPAPSSTAPAPSETREAPPTLEPRASACVARPLDVAPFDAGVLRFEEAIELIATDEAFGGLSALEHSEDGNLLALSDSGRLVEIDLERGADDGLVAHCAMRALTDAAGRPLTGAANDSEGLAWLDADTLLVSFEREDRVQAYALHGSGSLAPAGRPIDFSGAGLEFNQGIEALARLPSGALLAGGETPTILGRPHPVWRLEPRAPADVDAGPFASPGEPAFTLDTAPGYGLVAFDVTPAGGLIVLERFYVEAIGNRIRIGWLPPGAAETATGRSTPRELGRLPDGALPVDNFEGALAAPGDDGRTTLWIVSDDNFSASQTTYLFRYSFDEAALADRPPS